MKKLNFLFVLVVVSFTLTGCINVVNMRKVTVDDPNPTGLRVFLPQKYLVGRAVTNPTNNATKIVFDIEMYYDPNYEYAIDSYSILSKQNVNIHRSLEGYLKELDLNEDSTTATAATMTGLGSIVAADFAAKAAATSNQGTNNQTGSQGGSQKPNNGGQNNGGQNNGGQNNGGQNNGGQNNGGQNNGGQNNGGQNNGGQNNGGQNNGGQNNGGQNQVAIQSQLGPVKVLYRIDDIEADKTNPHLIHGGLQLVPVQYQVYNYFYKTNFVDPTNYDSPNFYPDR